MKWRYIEAIFLSRGTWRAYPLLHADKQKKKGSLFPQVAFFMKGQSKNGRGALCFIGNRLKIT
jgi:hypothetical protein